MTSTNIDRRSGAARFYDLQDFDDDLPFYRGLMGTDVSSFLELGCGTGRVLLALAEACELAVGVEISPAMLAVARGKARVLPSELQQRVRLVEGDITNFDLGRTFDLIVAPFRVFQALDSDAEVQGFFQCVGRHLSPAGSCVVTAFHPTLEPDALRRRWVGGEEILSWERQVEGERIVAWDRRRAIDRERLVLYPELVFRRYRGEELAEEVVMPIVMRCWYPEQLVERVEEAGFRVLERWGGYRGEPYGEGEELVVRFGR